MYLGFVCLSFCSRPNAYCRHRLKISWHFFFLKDNVFVLIGKSLAHAAEEAAMTAAQEAKRAAAAAEDMMLLARRAAEKASRALKIAEDYGAKKSWECELTLTPFKKVHRTFVGGEA